MSQIVKLLLLVISYFYGIIVKSHHFFYKVNLLKRYKSNRSVISVGNITLGGTGKTPFVIRLAEYLAQKNRKQAVLIRGYGEDEWKMLEDKLRGRGVTIFVGRDRIKNAKKAEKEGIESIILDDGFQHRRLKRDLDIVLIDSTNPFGNKKLFPRGILREPVTSLKRADIVVLTKTDKGKSNVSEIENEIKKIIPGRKILKAFHRPTNLVGIWKKDTKELSVIRNKIVCIISAICDPSYFKYTIEKIGARVGLEYIFPDHYLYKPKDLNRIFERCETKGIDTIVTTEKDAVKLEKLTQPKDKKLDMFGLCVELEIIDGRESLDAIFHRLHRCNSL